MTKPANKSDFEIHPFPVAKTTDEQRSVEPAPVVTAETKAKPVKKGGGGRKFVLLIILLAALSGGGWLGYQWWTVGRFFVSTDDAYVTADIATISPKVTGYVKELNVVENAIVKKGDPLVTIDDGDYRIAIDLVSSQLAVQEKTLLRIQAQTEAAKASLLQANASKAAAQAAFDNAKLGEDRAQKLLSSQTAPQSALDNAHAAVLQTTAALAALMPRLPPRKPISLCLKRNMWKHRQAARRWNCSGTKPSAICLLPFSEPLPMASSAIFRQKWATSFLPGKSLRLSCRCRASISKPISRKQIWSSSAPEPK